jgi:succinate dehydrogenase/fumarate reductase flavoprotein subunit
LIVKTSSEYDVVVLGAGAGGMTAACVAAAEGLRVLVIEKSPFVGGTTALSGGMVWIPANAKATRLGSADTIERARLYLEHTVSGSFNANLRRAFLTNGEPAIAYLEAKTSVRLRPVKIYPDYYPDLPGATTAGRVLEPVPFDGRALGEHFGLLRWPLREFMLLGGMMIDRADIPHFRSAGRSWRSTAHVARLLARYGWERLFVQRGASLYLGNALAGRLLHSLLTLKVDLVLNAAVSRLIYDGASVHGVAMTNGTDGQQILARRGVVLATGGFSHRPEMRARYLPNSAGALSAACPSNAGDGIELASAAGARVWDRNTDNAFWTPVSRFVRRDGSEGIFPHTVTDRAKPGVIAVNRRGSRFTNEAISYHEFVRAMFQTHHEGPSIPAYLICDRRFLWKYGLGAVKPFSLSLRKHLKSGYLTRGRTVGALALALGIDPDNLAGSVRRFNKDAREGVDRDFGRGGDAYQRYLGDADNRPNPCVAPIEQAPFYAIALYPGDLGTVAGLVTDENARVLDNANRPIRRLYACGNDMNSIMNGAYPGPGITLGPALTFAYLAARHIVSECR